MNLNISGSLVITRVEGKFVSKDEIIEIVQAAVDSFLSEVESSLTGLGEDGTSEYQVEDSNIEVS